MTAPSHRQCAAALVTNTDNEVLLVRQNYGRHFWGAPGGIVDPGETPMQAARREAAEEAGIDIEITAVVGIYLLQGGGWPDILAHVFQARILGGHARIVDPQEIAALEWRDFENLPTLLVPDVEAALEDLKSKRCGVVRTIQRKVIMSPLSML
ncbi:NUDIX domain-containing protein [Deinococcus peraridilitoris]|uniref:ADP-ribose pyrophosphatase n=1 Tax=Deinococcus peraridilitoris (strain DSM 19664 / LMG 22246 / CIP 109416 / KR-200) TaxID=937777 RepID=K9ZXM9_DEIPD|nr:NUDIX domain-containing protein [Deinococcus peraridilitoris]AFZ66423.1 ADP-ribose pyrophosphatase [Deinococcus peraridilitoris DSM 19664]